MIFVDGSADVDLQAVGEENIKFIPMEYSLAGEMRVCDTMQDRQTLKDFYNGQRRGDLTKTTQISPYMYEEFFAPYMEKGLEIRLTGKVVSSSYIDMTLQIMREFGAEVGREDTVIGVKPGEYRSVPYRVESDWSAASYFYELLAIAGEGEIILTGLKEKSMQGDSRQTVVWRKLGVRTCYEGDLVRLSAAKPEIDRLDYDFVEMPDLVQSFAVACCMRRIPFLFRGVETLRIKETDRIQALIEELGKLGYLLKAEGDGALIWEGERTGGQPCPRIATYHDHRMAMAFAPAALKHPGLVIVDKEVVSKSFPRYWEALAGCFGTKSGYSDS